MSTETEHIVPSEHHDTYPIEIISDDRQLSLRQFAPEDAEEIFELIDSNRDHLSQFGEDTSEKYPTYETVLYSILKPKNPDRLRFAMRNRDGEYMGSINLTPKGGFQQGEIGYYIGKDFGGKEYTTNAVKTLSSYAFNNLGYETLFGVVDVQNTASIRVLEKAGYQQIKKRIEDNGQIVVELYKIKPE